MDILDVAEDEDPASEDYRHQRFDYLLDYC